MLLYRINNILILLLIIICLLNLGKGNNVVNDDNNNNHNIEISLVEQAQIGNFKTKWHHIGKGKNPIYGIDSTVSIVPPYSRQDYATTEIFKMKFAFANYKFLIPWILLADGNGLYLKKIIFIIKYDETNILSINSRQIYFDLDDARAHAKPKNIDLEYRWEEEKYLHGMVNNTTASIVLCFLLILLSICKYINIMMVKI